MKAGKVAIAVKRWGSGLIIAVVAAAAIASMSRGHSLIWGVDAAWPLDLREVPRYAQIVDGSLGAPDVRKLPFLTPMGGLLLAWRGLGLPYNASFAQHLVLWGLLTIAGLSAGRMVNVLFRNLRRSAVLTASIFYMFNLYALTTIWTPVSNLLFHYSLLPLVFVLWHRAFEARSPVRGLLAAAVWSLTLTPAYTTTPVVVTDFLLLGSLLLMHIVRSKGSRGRLIATGGVMAGGWLVLNLFWLLPLVHYLGAETARGLAPGNPQDLFRLNSAPFSQAIRLSGYWGLNAEFKGSAYFPWGSFYRDLGRDVSWLIPGLAGLTIATRGFYQIIRGRHTDDMPHTWYLTILLTVFLILVTGATAPFGSFKTWAMLHVGVFESFRSTYQRFMTYVVLAYTPLVAAGTHILSDFVAHLGVRTKRDVSNRIGTSISSLVCVVFGLVLAAPLWTPAFSGKSGVIPSRRTTVPAEYQAVAAWFSRQGGDFNVVAYPNGPGLLQVLEWEKGTSGYLGVEPLSLLINRPLAYQDSTAPYLRKLLSQAADGDLSSLRLLNARYVVVHEDAHTKYLAGLSEWIGADVPALIARLNVSPHVRQVLRAGGLRVFEVRDWSPSRLMAVHRAAAPPIHAADVRSIPYRVVAPGRYVFPSTAVQQDEMLLLNSPFDDRWRASGKRPIRASPGMTAFVGPFDGTTVIVEHSLQRRFPILLGTTFIAPILLPVCGILLWRGKRRPPMQRSEEE